MPVSFSPNQMCLQAANGRFPIQIVGGFEATGMIRKLEAEQGYSHVPIIALTGMSP